MSANADQALNKILLTGASGYVGGRLLRSLESRGYGIRCLARRPEYLDSKVGANTEVVRGDVLEPDRVRAAMSGIDVAYYLVHSMGSSGDFSEEDREAASNFALAAREAGVSRIVYLGGLGHGRLSPHLASRQEVGTILRNSGVTTIELRSSIVIGSGSLSFELVRGLVERLPIMITPRWVATPTQPIAIEDVIEYLVLAAELDVEGSVVFEIGGPERSTYGGLMKEYARQRGLWRLMIPVPVLTPGLSSLWLGLVTPVYSRVGRKLIDSLKNETVVTDGSALQAFPIRPRGVREAIARALANEDREFALTRWSDALSSSGDTRSWGGVRFGSRIVDSRTAEVPVDAETAFALIRTIGGETGWYYADWLWHLRGFLDLLVGGVGLRRGRRDPGSAVPGDALDFWRVEAFDPPHRLRLLAEMKMPGRGWLDLEVEPTPEGARIRQTAIFDPAGLAGRAYWYALYPLHELVFSGMLRGIARAAVESRAIDPDSEPVRIKIERAYGHS